MTTKDGGPAFPALHSIDGNWVKEPLPQFRGMTLRDWFAAMAMNGFMSDSEIRDTEDRIALASYRLADAMLRARNAA